jgi:hypothetical protein
MATTSKTGTGANFTEDGRPIDHSFVSLSEYQNARGQPQTDYEGLVYDAAGGSRIMTPQGERYFSPYAAQPTKEELSWLMSQPNLTNIQDPTTREQTLESWQESRPGYVDPMKYNTFEEYIADANPNYRAGKDAGNDLTNRANFYGMTIENYQNALAGDPTRPMGANQAVYGSQLLSPIERLAAETARGQGFSTMSPKTLALAQANPDVFNAASQRYQNYFANTYPGTLEYESVLSGPMQFSSAGVKYPEIKDTASMYILDPRTKRYVKNPNYKPPVRKADGGLMSMADGVASRGRGSDSMLVHMTPNEVRGLQALAMKNGGSLTINPETGLPEAGFLDKLLPAIIGFGLNYFVPGLGSAIGGALGTSAAVGTGIAVGGIQTLRTGDIGKGIAAGLGAYGGAGLSEGLMAAGSTEAGLSSGALSAELAQAQGLPEGLSSGDAFNKFLTSDANPAVSEALKNATPFERMSAGFDAAKANPSSLLTKDNFKYLGAAAAPILADQAIKSNLPTTTTKPGMIRPYSFDPYGGTYTAGTPYEAQAKKAAGGGLMGLANGGMAGYGDGDDVSRRTNDGMAQGGMYDFAQRSEPVVRMAGGGVVALAAGGDYRSLTKDSSAEDIASAYKQFTTASGGDTAANQKAAIDYLTNLGIGQDKIGQAYGTYQASPTYTDYTQQQAADYLTANKNINIAEETARLNANPTTVNQYIANLTSGYTDPTATKGGSGTAGFYNTLTAQGIDPNEYYSAITSVDPNYATQGFSKADIAEQYAIHKGANALTDQIARDKIAADPVLGYDKQWVKFMDDNNYSVLDAARAFGLSTNEVKSRYDAVKAAEKKVITPITPLPVPVVPAGPKITTPITYNTAGTNPPTPIESVLGLPPGVGGAGITTVNPGGTITTRPNIPGIPEGGFTGMTSLRDTYEKGGGSLGVNKNLFVPKTQDELFARYKNTGGSKAAFDYLMGKTPYSPTPYTPTGEIMKPYFESVGRFPENRKAKKYVFVDGKYQLNPDYVKPSYVLAGEKAAALADPENPPTAKAGEGKKWVWSDEAKKWEVKPINAVVDTTVTGQNDGGGGGEANGGLMAMARGGMAQQFNLGDYSDGGRLLRGPGDGISDSIPATIGNKRPARLADGEFVVPARIVSELGNGSTEAGARKLYAMMDRVQKARRGTVGKGKVAKNSRSDKYLPA